MGEVITKSIIIKGRLSEVFTLWSNVENFPRFLERVKTAMVTGENTSHWVLEGANGELFEWDALITTFEENKRIAWKGMHGNLKTSGQVTFNNLPYHETELTVIFQYAPPAGVPNETIAQAFGDPGELLMEALRRFKRFAEGQPDVVKSG